MTGWESFEPWLSTMEQLEPQRIWEIAETLPPEWYEGNVEVLEELVGKLLARRPQVRDRITEFRESSRLPFPNWNRALGDVRSGPFSEQMWGDSYPGRVM